MSGALQAVYMNQRGFVIVTGQEAFVTPGSYSWVAPTGVTKVSVVAVAGGGFVGSQPAAGGGLGYKNSITVSPGTSYTVVVGCQNEESYFINNTTVAGKAPTSSNANQFKDIGGVYVGDGGGNGGPSGYEQNAYSSNGGGGAGGYSGNGGGGARSGSPSPRTGGEAGSGGGGGGGGGNTVNGGGGGGVGILGQGTNGAASGAGTNAPPGGTATSSFGGGGSGGSNGTARTITTTACGCPAGSTPGNGGNYGGGAGLNSQFPTFAYSTAGKGAVRIIWPGCARSFPSTRTTNE